MPTAAYFFSESTRGREKKKNRKRKTRKTTPRNRRTGGNQWIFFFFNVISLRVTSRLVYLFIYFLPTGESDLRRKVGEKYTHRHAFCHRLEWADKSFPLHPLWIFEMKAGRPVWPRSSGGSDKTQRRCSPAALSIRRVCVARGDFNEEANVLGNVPCVQ